MSQLVGNRKKKMTFEQHTSQHHHHYNIRTIDNKMERDNEEGERG
jgi:hypothetical protein